MKRLYLMLALLVLGSTAVAADKKGMDEVKSLGELNGKALACGQKENISLIKSVMISHAPKTRRYGIAFEQSTEESFMQRSRETEACGDDPIITLKVKSLEARLQELFPPRKN